MDELNGLGRRLAAVQVLDFFDALERNDAERAMQGAATPLRPTDIAGIVVIEGIWRTIDDDEQRVAHRTLVFDGLHRQRRQPA